MFKPIKKKSVKAKEKVTFRLEFRATKVPQGWDKLLVSLVSQETSKAVGKTGKASVKNGSCQWSDPILESIYRSQDSDSKVGDKQMYKLVVSMGSSRFGMLGESSINLMDYLHTSESKFLPFPLQNTKFDCILHVKIQPTTPKLSIRDTIEHKEMDTNQTSKSDNFTPQMETDSLPVGDDDSLASHKDFSHPLSISSHSFDSLDIPVTPGGTESHPYGRDEIADEDFLSLSSSPSSSGRHEMGSGSQDNSQEFVRRSTFSERSFNSGGSSPLPYFSKSGSQDDDLKSLGQDFDCNVTSDVDKSNEKNVWKTSQRRNRLQRATSSAVPTEKTHNSTNHAAIAEIESLKQQLSAEVSRREALDNHVSLLTAECDSLREEITELKSQAKPHDHKDRDELVSDIKFSMKELHDELEYEKSMNANLTLQLQKTQESNSQLLLEIQDLLDQNPQNDGQESEVEAFRKKLEEVEKDSQELTEENLDLLSQLKKANEKLKEKDELIDQLESRRADYHADSRDEIEELTDRIRSYEEKHSALEKLLKDSEDKAVAAVTEYQNTLKIVEQMKVERAKLDVHIFEERKEAGLTISQLQAANSALRAELNEERIRSSELFEKIKEVEAQCMDLSKTLAATENECKTLQQNVTELKSTNTEMESTTKKLMEENSLSQSRIEDLELKVAAEEAEKHRLEESKYVLENANQALKSLNESSTLQKNEERCLEQPKNDKEDNAFLELKQRLSEKEELENVLKIKIFKLEQELEVKITALGTTEEKLIESEELLKSLQDKSNKSEELLKSAELKLKENEELSRSNDLLATTQLSEELSVLKDKLKCLENEVNEKADLLELSKHQLKEQHEQLSLRIEQLEQVNDKLEKDCSSCKQSREEIRKTQDFSAAKDENLLERISILENELAELVESNNMYKAQLQSAFEKQQIVQAAALENLGSVDQVIQDLRELKRMNVILEDELCNMKERYFKMSIQFAEVEAEREQLVMTIKHLRGTKKLIPFKSLNF